MTIVKFVMVAFPTRDDSYLAYMDLLTPHHQTWWDHPVDAYIFPPSSDFLLPTNARLT